MEILESTAQVIDHQSSAPLYLQLKNHLLQLIRDQEIVEGERLPTERELQAQLGLSRATIRQALSELSQEGFVERRRGIGTIVCHHKIKPEIMKLTSFTEDMLARGLAPDAKTLDLNFDVPPKRVQQALGLGSNEKVWCVKRIRLANGEPVGLHDLYIPPTLEIAPNDLMKMKSYYRLLSERHTLIPTYAVETLTAMNATRTEANILEFSEGSSLLIIWRTTFSKTDQVLEVVRIAYRADRYEYEIHLFR
jgi:GntR family transcriptional regulator